jgi:hypothetical protein
MITTMSPWTVVLRCTTSSAKILVTEQGDDVLKARLSPHPGHPRALVTLMEGLSLWRGTPLCVAVCAEDDAQDCFERVFYGDGFVGPESPLVYFEHRHRNEHPHRLRGVGDFRQLRLPWELR